MFYRPLYAILGAVVLVATVETSSSQEFRTLATACNTYSNKDHTITFAGADNIYSFTNLAPNNYGLGVITSASENPTQVVYKFCVSSAAARYKMSVKYTTANERRPVNIDLNGTSLGNDLLGLARQSWNLDGQQWQSIGYVQLKTGSGIETSNTLTISRPRSFPHISEIMFEPVP